MNNKIEDKEFEKLEDPTEEDLHSPLFESIWQSIKKWDIERDYGLGRAGATGTDVKTIMNAVESYILSRDQALLEAFKKDVGEMIGENIPLMKEEDSIQFTAGQNLEKAKFRSLLEGYNLNK